MSEAREHFTAIGKLTKPVRPVHTWTLGRLIGEWQLSANRTWGELTEKGHLVTSGLEIATVEDVTGLRYIRIIVGPLLVRLAWI